MFKFAIKSPAVLWMQYTELLTVMCAYFDLQRVVCVCVCMYICIKQPSISHYSGPIIASQLTVEPSSICSKQNISNCAKRWPTLLESLQKTCR